MKLFGLEITRKAKPIERKSFMPLGQFSNFLSSYGHTDLSSYVVLNLFSQTAPLNNAIDIISNELATLTPQVVDKNNEVVPNHPVLELLKAPNADSTQNEFLYKLTAFFISTGNGYIVGTGPVSLPPLEISISFPQQVTLQSDARDGLASIINNQTCSSNIEFKRHEVKSRFRFYHQDEREIWHLKTFNPIPGILTGQSPASSIFPEIDLYNFSSIHNVSLLKRGGRPSGILMMSTAKNAGNNPEPPMTDAQYNRIQEQTNNFLAGAENAGKVLVAEGANVDYKDIITSNRDMDLLEGRKDVKQTIYNKYHIPLPFVNPERQTFANMGLAKEQLYDNAVIPLADRIFNELDLFLMPRYGKRSEGQRLTYNKAIIPALQARKTRDAEKRKKLGIFTDNELRAQLGVEPYVGGDIIYKPGNEVPVGNDAYTGDEPPVPKTTKKRFAEIMKNKGYLDDKIESLSILYNLK